MKLLHYIVFAFLFLSIGSCQDEEETIIQDDTQSFSATSPLADLLERTTQHPTTYDNVIDDCSCFSVQLPVTVTVNSQQINVNTQSDYQLVQNVKDAYTNDDDIVHFSYPITVVHDNFQTQVLSNYNEYEQVVDNCYDDNGFGEIDCISLVYPITMNVYDSNNQLANTVTVTSNSVLYNFLENLTNNVFVAVNYPISAINSNGQTVSLHTNSELENFIENSIDDCSSSTPGGGSAPNLTDVLTASGTWRITYFYDDADETSHFYGYNFMFHTNGTVVAVKYSTTINGNWNTYINSGETKLNLNFEGSTLEEIEDDWRVIEFSTTQIRLRHTSGGGGGTDYLTFTKN